MKSDAEDELFSKRKRIRKKVVEVFLQKKKERKARAKAIFTLSKQAKQMAESFQNQHKFAATNIYVYYIPIPIMPVWRDI